jgi:hypothetical protein
MRNITPCIVAVQKSCGVRRNLSKLLLAITKVLEANEGGWVATEMLAI